MRSLCNNLKIHFILQTLQDCDVKMECITQSWLTEGHNHTAAILNSFGYDLSHYFRPNRPGGGVAILIKKPLSFKKVALHLEIDSFE